MATDNQKVADGMVVSFQYKLYVDGKLYIEEDADGDDNTIDYLHGADNILPGLEQALAGKRAGDTLSVMLSPDEAYGEYDDEDMETLDRSEVPDAEELAPGMLIEVENEDGSIELAHVKEITPQVVVLDFNHPLAGKSLKYDIEVLGVRQADEDELKHGHAHGVYDDEEEWDEDDEA
ncbi:MAG: peptidylprolyl isomerase [bacterium]|nr:peptidylprolyl isomerase [bacterium]